MYERLRQFYDDNPLAFRLMGAIVLLSSIITLIAILLLLAREYDDGMLDTESDLKQIEVSVLPSITLSLWNFDEEQLQVQLNALLQLEQIIGAEVQWRDWQGDQRTLSVGTSEKDAERFLASYPIIYRHQDGTVEELGTLKIHTSHEAIYQSVGESAAFIILFQFVKTAIIASLIILLIRHMLGRHLRDISKFARGLSISKLHHSLTLERRQKQRDELQDIADAINEMRRTLRQDILHKERTEKELIEEQRQRLILEEERIRAESASAAKTQFLATMSHEIRTPMNGIIGVLDLLAHSSLDSRQQHYVDLMQHSSENLLAILNDILDFSKIEAGQFALDKVQVDVQSLVEDAISAFAGAARQQSIELIIETTLINNRHIYSDPLRLRQILLNLINNAIKFTREGHVLIRAFDTDLGNNEYGLRLEVQDSGIGIPSEKQQSIFDVFSQVSEGTNRTAGGSGLGLAVCRRLVELMGGKIGVDSIPGRGSSFWIELTPAKLSNAETFHPLPDSQALLICKHEPQLNAVANMLRHLGAQVTSGSSLSMIEMGGHFDHILIDSEIIDETAEEYQRSLSRLKDRITLMAPIDYTRTQYPVVDRPVTLKALTDVLEHKPEELKSSASSVKEHTRFDHLNVLVAEDNEVNRDVIRAILSALRIQPVLCQNGEEAVAAFRASGGAFDIILMDCEMPVMDGIEATRRIRQIERDAELTPVPIAALTAHVLQEQRQRMREAGMNHYLSKPVRKDAIQKLLSNLGLEKHLHVVQSEKQ